MKCIICKQEVKGTYYIETPNGVVHVQGCSDHYKELANKPNLNESDFSQQLEEIQML